MNGVKSLAYATTLVTPLALVLATSLRHITPLVLLRHFQSLFITHHIHWPLHGILFINITSHGHCWRINKALMAARHCHIGWSLLRHWSLPLAITGRHCQCIALLLRSLSFIAALPLLYYSLRHITHWPLPVFIIIGIGIATPLVPLATSYSLPPRFITVGILVTTIIRPALAPSLIRHWLTIGYCLFGQWLGWLFGHYQYGYSLAYVILGHWPLVISIPLAQSIYMRHHGIPHCIGLASYCHYIITVGLIQRWSHIGHCGYNTYVIGWLLSLAIIGHCNHWSLVNIVITPLAAITPRWLATTRHWLAAMYTLALSFTH